MSFQGLDWQTWQMRFTAGLNQKSEPRSLEPPQLSIAKDVQADEVGGLQTRYPFGTGAFSTNAIHGGGTITNARVLATRDGEIVCFTDTALYTWDARAAKWASRGTHLAVDVQEEIKCATNADQLCADRAEVSNMVVYTWSEGNVAVASAVYCSAIDKTTGSVIVAPITMGGGDNVNRPRLVAMDAVILLFYNNVTTGFVHVVVLDPVDPFNTITSGNDTAIGAATHNAFYDVTRVLTQNTVALVQRLTPTTSYAVHTYTAAGVVISTAVKARQCAGPIAVSSTPDGASLQVVRDYGNDAGTYRVRGDLLVRSSLADTYINQEIGTYPVTTRLVVDQIAAAHRSTTDSGQYRCYVFWGFEEEHLGNVALPTMTKYNWVDTGNTLGTQADFLAWCSPASRAFSYNGRVYVWVAFGSRATVSGYVWNTYLLYRDDKFWTAASRTGNAFYAGDSSFSWLTIGTMHPAHSPGETPRRRASRRACS